MIVIGIDPGLTGALAFVDSLGSRAIIEDIPTRELPGNGRTRRRIDGHALAQLVRRHVPADRAITVVCEAVRIFGSGDAAGSTQSGSLMRSLGAIEAVFDVLRAPASLIEPSAWQRHYGLQGKKVKRDAGTMPEAIRIACELYPNSAYMLQRVKDHNRAEALLIAHYGARTLA